MKTLVLPLLALGAAVVTQTLAREMRQAVEPIAQVAGVAGPALPVAQQAGRPVLVAQLDPARGGRSGK